MPLTPGDAFKIYLNYGPELEFLRGYDGNDPDFSDAVLDAVQTIIPSPTGAQEIFIKEAGSLYRLAKDGFFELMVEPFQKTLKETLSDKYYVVTKNEIDAIARDHPWSIKRKRGKPVLFQIGFLFDATQGKCTATPWFWRNGNRLGLTFEDLAGKLKDKFSIPQPGSWQYGALISNPVEYKENSDIEKLNGQLILPITFAVEKIMEYLESWNKS